MYYFASLEEISSFLLKFGIDIDLFSPFELSTTIILYNLFKVITVFIIGYIVYRIILKIIDFIRGV